MDHTTIKLNPKPNISDFSKHLFWDVNRENIDFDKDKSYIIKHILEYGLMDDWLTIYSLYGIHQIAAIVKTFREVYPIDLSFISLLSNTPKKEFRCYSYQQSVPKHWDF